ncbi:unnamed protein product [Cyprideis torosa]|uniref:BTB domain-containing protein n=1 Tax=Cyprideis torosa TaxID=163714 RepID=A0A7R8ZG44_9CRUS|nr:unnamed protein product [Cyprideis torosa]CAG0880737.1 unnamed protein product [Cyprideis torosa]
MVFDIADFAGDLCKNTPTLTDHVANLLEEEASRPDHTEPNETSSANPIYLWSGNAVKKIGVRRTSVLPLDDPENEIVGGASHGETSIARCFPPEKGGGKDTSLQKKTNLVQIDQGNTKRSTFEKSPARRATFSKQVVAKSKHANPSGHQMAGNIPMEKEIILCVRQKNTTIQRESGGKLSSVRNVSPEKTGGITSVPDAVPYLISDPKQKEGPFSVKSKENKTKVTITHGSENKEEASGTVFRGQEKAERRGGYVKSPQDEEMSCVSPQKVSDLPDHVLLQEGMEVTESSLSKDIPILFEQDREMTGGLLTMEQSLPNTPQQEEMESPKGALVDGPVSTLRQDGMEVSEGPQAKEVKELSFGSPQMDTSPPNTPQDGMEVSEVPPMKEPQDSEMSDESPLMETSRPSTPSQQQCMEITEGHPVAVLDGMEASSPDTPQQERMESPEEVLGNVLRQERMEAFESVPDQAYPIIVLKDVHWEDLSALLEFLYTGNVEVNVARIGPFLDVAHLLSVEIPVQETVNAVRLRDAMQSCTPLLPAYPAPIQCTIWYFDSTPILSCTPRPSTTPFHSFYDRSTLQETQTDY